jgi:hypothetical protein
LLRRYAPRDDGHRHARFRAGAFLGSAFAAFFGAAFFVPLLSFPAPASLPRLFFSAAIRSMTFEPLGGSLSGSWMIFSPLCFCFSAISPFSAST